MEWKMFRMSATSDQSLIPLALTRLKQLLGEGVMADTNFTEPMSWLADAHTTNLSSA